MVCLGSCQGDLGTQVPPQRSTGVLPGHIHPTVNISMLVAKTRHRRITPPSIWRYTRRIGGDQVNEKDKKKRWQQRGRYSGMHGYQPWLFGSCSRGKGYGGGIRSSVCVCVFFFRRRILALRRDIKNKTKVRNPMAFLDKSAGIRVGSTFWPVCFLTHTGILKPILVGSAISF